MPDERTRPARDDRDEVIKRQQDEIARLREELARAQRDRDRWKRQSDRLKQQLDAARRAGFRQAAPFAKDRPQGRGGRPPHPRGYASQHPCRIAISPQMRYTKMVPKTTAHPAQS